MDNRTIVEIEEQIKKEEKKIAALNAVKKAKEAKSPERQIANLMHALLCTWNHIDGCGYGQYPKVDYDPDSPSSWLSQAKRFMTELEKTEAVLHRSSFDLAKDALNALAIAQKTPSRSRY